MSVLQQINAPTSPLTTATVPATTVNGEAVSAPAVVVAVAEPTNSPQMGHPTSAITSHSPRTTAIYSHNQYACVRCRRLKKKCSKELPTCRNCNRQNESCEYVERKNKRRASISIALASAHDAPDSKKHRSHSSNSNNSNTNSSEGNYDTATESETSALTSAAVSMRRRTISNAHPHFPSTTTTINNDLLLSPRSTHAKPTIIQLPPIRATSINTNINGTGAELPSLSSYSLNGNNALEPVLLPSIPRQLLSGRYSFSSNGDPVEPHQLAIPPPSTSYRPRTGSRGSLSNRSLSPISAHRSTFHIPAVKITDLSPKTGNDNSIVHSILPSLAQPPRTIPLFEEANTRSIEFEMLSLMFSRIGLIDENIFSTFINHDLTSNFERTFETLLKIIVFIDTEAVLAKFEDFKKNNFNWNGKDQNSSDYVASIEFLLIYTCSIIIANASPFSASTAAISSSSMSMSKSSSSNTNSANSAASASLPPSATDIGCYHKFTFTMAFKLLQRKSTPTSHFQILKIMTLLQFTSIISSQELETSTFIQTNLSSYAHKYQLNRNLKSVNAKGITLPELELANRLFWSIFVADSLCATTTGQQPNFRLDDIDVPIPFPITKSEENSIAVQNIFINMSKIQNKIATEFYTANVHNLASEKFAILSAHRQDADMWYNECRILLSSLTDNYNLIANASKERKIAYEINLQTFASWISLEYYYTLTFLFKPSMLFPRPDIPNFTVISNATHQSTSLMRDVVKNCAFPLSSFFYARFSNITLQIFASLYKGMYTSTECMEILNHLSYIWKNGNNVTPFTTRVSDILRDMQQNLTPSFEKIKTLERNDLEVPFRPDDETARPVLAQIVNLALEMEKLGISVNADLCYLESTEVGEYFH